MERLSHREHASIEVVRSQAAAYSNKLWSDYLLVPIHIDRFLMSHHRYQVQGHEFMLIGSIPVSQLKST